MIHRIVRIAIATGLLVAGIGFQHASAQLLGGMATASVEEVGAEVVGGYVGVTGDFVSLTGQFRYGVASSFDLGAKAAFVDWETPGNSSLALNADGRIQLLDVYLQDPVDLSIGPEVTYFRVGDVTNWYFGGYAIVSKEFTLTSGNILAPYARLGLRLHKMEFGNSSDSETDAGASIGTKYTLSGYTSLWGEILIEDAGTGVYVGAQYQLR